MERRGICLRRMQDIDYDDDFCKECWDEGYEIDVGIYHKGSLCSPIFRYASSSFYTDREMCFEEHVVSEEEFNEIEKRRCEGESKLLSR